MKFLFYACFLTSTFLGTALRAQQKHFRLSGDARQPEICLDVAQNNQVQPELYLLNGNTVAANAVAGRYSYSGETVCYTPLYPLASGERFLVRAKGCTDTMIVIPEEKMRVPEAPATVAAIYPLADSIPENILFFHVRFSQAMKEDIKAWQKIMIYDEADALIPHTWRQRSFWLDSGRVLVLMIHPGRVKSGIRYIGPVFAKGKRYRVAVDSTLKDAFGRNLGATASKSYRVVQEQKEKLKAELTGGKPVSGTTDPVMIRFNNAADHAAALTALQVLRSSGEEVAYTLVQDNSNTLRLQPKQPWTAGKHRIVLGGRLYDCTGNRLNRLFEMKSDETFIDDEKPVFLPLSIE